MTRQNIIDLLGEDWNATIESMDNALRSSISLINSTNAAVLEHSGKQMRPMLSLLMAKATSKDGRLSEDSVRFAVASELLHNAALMHDDVADGSSMRRGGPSVMSMLGSTGAVLLGDYWFVRAVSIILESSSKDRIMGVFAKTIQDLSEGEMLQMEKALSADTTEEDYFRIIYCKTASLFEAACLSGAISVDAPQEWIDAAQNYAVALGIAFQIRDDIMDYNGGDAMGKPAGVDLREQKITLPLLGAMKDSPHEAQIRAKVKDIASDPSAVGEILDFVKESDGMSYAKRTLDEYIEKAVRALDPLPDSKEKAVLVELARYNATRNV